MKRNLALAGAVLLALLVVVVALRRGDAPHCAPDVTTSDTSILTPDANRVGTLSSVPPVGDTDCADEPEAADENAPETASAEDAFDAEVDRWMEPQPGGVTTKDVEAFRAAFDRVPSDARDACLQRALNLIPDANALLLAGLLLDKTQGRETIEAVFNDVLNRDEQVKQSLLKIIYRDRTHPCWADAAWILDVTGTTESKTAD